MKMTKEKFAKYVKVQKSGVTNMFDLRAVTMLSGLKREECIDIMEHYSEYANKWKLGNYK